MVGEGFAIDMIRRIKLNKEASRLRRERASERVQRMHSAESHYPLPDTTPEEMEKIIHQSEEKKEKDESYFKWGGFIIFGGLIVLALIAWGIFLIYN